MKNITGFFLVPVIVAGLSVSCSKQEVSGVATLESIGADLQAAPGDSSKWDSLKVSVPGYLKENPDDPPAMAILGIVKLHFGELKEAKALINSASLKDPGNQFAVAGLSNIAMKEKNWQGVIDIVKPALAKSPNNENFHMYLATAYQEQGKELEAEAHLARVHAINPSYKGIPVSSLGEFVQFLRETKDAIETIIGIAELIQFLFLIFW